MSLALLMQQLQRQEAFAKLALEAGGFSAPKPPQGDAEGDEGEGTEKRLQEYKNTVSSVIDDRAVTGSSPLSVDDKTAAKISLLRRRQQSGKNIKQNLSKLRRERMPKALNQELTVVQQQAAALLGIKAERRKRRKMNKKAKKAKKTDDFE